jgi:type I restriction enzyme S subunit
MKSGWQTNTLGDVLAVLRNGINCKQDKSGKGDKISRIESISDARFDFEKVGYAELSERDKERYRLQEGDILFSHINSAVHVGKTAVFDSSEPVYHGVNLLLMRPKDVVTSAYLDHALKYLFQSGYWRGVCKQSVNQASVNQQDISRVQISYPKSLPEQKRIVGILDEAFEGIATAKSNAEKNLQNACALFKSHLQSVFTQRGKGWAEKRLGDVCGFVRGPFGGSLKKSIFVANGYAVYEQQHAIYDQFDDVRYFIDEAKFKEMQRFELLPNDLIMSCSGTMGRVAIVPDGIKRGIINQALLKLTPSDRILNVFLKFWMESDAFQDALKEYSGGAAIQNVASVKVLKEIKVPLPSVEEQGRIVERLESVREETRRLESIYQQKLAALEALKKSLLHQAFTGQLRGQL